MARADWRKYYVLVFADGTCAPYCRRNLKDTRLHAKHGKSGKVPVEVRVPGRSKVVGILHVKGRNASAQKAIFARCID